MINEGSGFATTGSGTGTSQVSGSSLIDSDRVQGTKVFDPSGKDIGTIKRLIIEKVSGRCVYAVAQFGGFLGLGGQEYTIPWNKLSYDTSFGGYRTDVTEEQLKGAPQLGEDDWASPDRHGERTLRDYYNSPYYWE